MADYLRLAVASERGSVIVAERKLRTGQRRGEWVFPPPFAWCVWRFIGMLESAVGAGREFRVFWYIQYPEIEVSALDSCDAVSRDNLHENLTLRFIVSKASPACTLNNGLRCSCLANVSSLNAASTGGRGRRETGLPPGLGRQGYPGETSVLPTLDDHTYPARQVRLLRSLCSSACRLAAIF